MGHTDADEHDCKGFRALAAETRVAGNLNRDAVVRQPAAGENRQLLAAHEAVQDIDGGNAGFNEVSWLRAMRWIYGEALDAQTLNRRHGRAAVDDAPDAVENSPQELGPDAEPERLAVQTNSGRGRRQPLGGFQHFDYHVPLVEQRYPSETPSSVAANHVHRLVEADVDVTPHEQQRPLDAGGRAFD